MVALVTRNARGTVSEVALGTEDGLPRECVVTLDNLRTVPKAQLTEPIVTLNERRVHDICRALSRATGCS